MMLFLVLAPAHPPRQSAEAVVRRAFAAIGGEERWRAVRTLELIGRGSQNHIGDSEWFDGPFFVDYVTVDEWRDVPGIRHDARVTVYGAADTASYARRTVSTLGGTTQAVGEFGDKSPSALAPDTLALVLAPERMLWTALNAPDLHSERDTVFRFVTHNVVAFHVGAASVRIFFEAESGVPRMMEVRRAFPTSVFWTAWGDVLERVRYSDWSVEQTGIWYPRQIDRDVNGLPWESMAYGAVRVNAAPPAGTFDAPTGDGRLACGFGCLAADSVPLGIGGAGGVSSTGASRGAHEIGAGIVQIVGAWNSTLVRQDDGVVVIEAPISAGYSRRVIEEAARRFPGVPVKAVVTTTDFWWHVAGLREYVARGIPIYVLDRNVRVVQDRVRAPHTLVPDSLARAPRPAILKPVDRRMTLGTGDNAIELIPFHADQLDRMLMVYLPHQHLVYTAEGVQLYPFGLSAPQTAVEVVNVVKREGLAPERFIGMHVAVTPWARLTTILDSLAIPH